MLAVVILLISVGYALLRGQDEPAAAASAVNSSGAALGTLEDLERRAAASPSDAGIWKTLGDEYFNRGDFPNAVLAFEKAAQFAPGKAVMWSSLGEARVMASTKDPLPGPALDAFRRAVAIDAKDPRARYFLAVKRDLDGDHKGAIADWLSLLKDTPDGAPWQSDLRRTIEQVGKINGIAVAPQIAAIQPAARPAAAARGGLPGPTQQDLAAASAMPPSQQREMAEGMVERLENRLKSQPNNLDGWVMLMRSRMNLAQPDKAAKALSDALAANPAQAQQLRMAGQELGIR